MKLESNKEILIAKIIGLLNGLDGEGTSFKEENMLRSALDAIKNNRDLTKYITFFEKRKENTYQIVLLVKVHVEEVMIIILINNLIILKRNRNF